MGGENRKKQTNCSLMAFGTKGDVYAIAAVAGGFACDQRKYEVIFISHSPHQDLAANLAKNTVKREHMLECLTIMERIYGDGPSMKEAVQARISSSLPIPETLIEAPDNKLGWKDVIHWMWPLITEDWGSWRSDELNLSPLPFTDPVMGLPMWHERPLSSLLLYGFSREVVECPDYWPLNSLDSRFWFLPSKWKFSCSSCSDMIDSGSKLCSAHTGLQSFLIANLSTPRVFIGFSSA